MKIRRDSYLEQLISRKWNGMIKVVAGMRRSGKSYLLFKLFVAHLKAEGVDDRHIVTIELDRKENEQYRSADALYKYIKARISRRGKYYVLIDEIQLAGDDFYEVLNSLLHYSNVDTYVTGSNSRFLVTDIVTEFRGRSDEIMMRPLSFAEWMGNAKRDWRDEWADYFTFGGLPKVRETSSSEGRIAYLKQVFAKTYLTDIVERNHIKNVDDLSGIVCVFASGAGSLTNVQTIANTYKTVKGRPISKKDEEALTWSDLDKKRFLYAVKQFWGCAKKNYELLTGGVQKFGWACVDQILLNMIIVDGEFLGVFPDEADWISQYIDLANSQRGADDIVGELGIAYSKCRNVD